MKNSESGKRRLISRRREQSSNTKDVLTDLYHDKLETTYSNQKKINVKKESPTQINK